MWGVAFTACVVFFFSIFILYAFLYVCHLLFPFINGAGGFHCLCQLPFLTNCSRSRVGQNRIYAPYMTVYLAISLPKLPHMHRINNIYGYGHP